MKSPTEVLMAEHRVIEQVLDGLEAFASTTDDGTGAGAAEARAVLARYVEFLGAFADRCHHGKEEDLLFPVLEARGLPASGGPTAMMRQEHEEGRLHVRALARLAAGEGPLGADERVRLRQTAGAYAALLRAHIAKEDRILFPLAERVLDPEISLGLTEAFDRFEHEQIGSGTHRRLHAMAASLTKGARS